MSFVNRKVQFVSGTNPFDILVYQLCFVSLSLLVFLFDSIVQVVQQTMKRENFFIRLDICIRDYQIINDISIAENKLLLFWYYFE